MRTKRMRVSVLAIVTICCAFEILQAQGAGTATADKPFLTMADESNSAEIAASQMALKKSKNPEIKSFAQQMIADHEKLRADTLTLAQQMGVMTPQPLNDTHKAEAKRLSALSAKSFDMEYIKTMDLDHHKALDMFKNEISTTSNPDLKAAISQGEPVIQQHTNMADQMAQKMNVQSGTSGGR
jgi:putative membrane protein